MDRLDALALDLHDQQVPLARLRNAVFLERRARERAAIYDALIAREGDSPRLGAIDWDGLAADPSVKEALAASRPSLLEDIRWEVLFAGWQLLAAPRSEEDFDGAVARLPGRSIHR